MPKVKMLFTVWSWKRNILHQFFQKEGSSEIHSYEGRKTQPPYLFTYSILPTRKGLKVAHIIGCKISHVYWEMGNQSFCKNPAFDWAASVCLKRKGRRFSRYWFQSHYHPCSVITNQLSISTQHLFELTGEYEDAKHSSCLCRET